MEPSLCCSIRSCDNILRARSSTEFTSRDDTSLSMDGMANIFRSMDGNGDMKDDMDGNEANGIWADDLFD